MKKACAGILLFVAMILVVAKDVMLEFPSWLAGIPLWTAAIMLAPNIKPAQRKQIGILLLVGAAGLIYAAVQGGRNEFFLRAVAGNQMLLAMLVGVSFLRLVALAGIAPAENLPKGRKVLLRTMASTHILGSVLNMSAPMIVGDRLAHARNGAPLDRAQGMVLLRAFSSAAFWSPFFGAMGLTLISAPGSQLFTLVLFGLPIALTALAITAWEIRHRPGLDEIRGFPLQWSSLRMPILMATLVIFAHLLLPAVTVLTLVTVLAFIYTVIWIALFGSRKSAEGTPMATAGDLLQHIKTGLPGMCSEISLFLGAAVLAAGVAAVLDVQGISVAPDHYGAMEACVTLVILVLAAMLGMHPVTTVAVAGSLLAPSVSDPNLLGMTLLMCWGMGAGISPMSGIQLTMQARYGLKARDILWANRFYAPLMFCVCFAMLFVYDAVRS